MSYKRRYDSEYLSIRRQTRLERLPLSWIRLSAGRVLLGLLELIYIKAGCRKSSMRWKQAARPSRSWADKNTGQLTTLIALSVRWMARNSLRVSSRWALTREKREKSNDHVIHFCVFRRWGLICGKFFAPPPRRWELIGGSLSIPYLAAKHDCAINCTTFVSGGCND